MPRRAHESSDGDASARDRGDAAVSGSRTSERRGILVDIVQAGDQALVSQIFKYLHPEEVLALSFTCRDIRSLLRAESSARIWKQARANAPGPTPPQCPRGLSEMDWTALLWQKKCCHCWARTTRDIDWGLRRRFCSSCQSKHVKGLLNMPKLYEGLSVDVFRLAPYSKDARSGKKTHYYWLPELEDVYNALKRLDEHVKAGKPRAEAERSHYIDERKRYVEEVLDAVPKCKKWHKQCQKQRKKAQAQVKDRVVKSLVNMGYDVADVEDVLRKARITEASVSDWNAFLKKYKPELDSRQRPLATESPSELLRSEYRRLLKTHTGPARGWEALVPFGDILAIPDVRSRLKRVSADNVADLAKRIPEILDTWRGDVEVQLLRTLPPPPKGVRKADAESPERLKFASSVWRRGDDPTPLTYPHMLLVPHVLCLEGKYGELKYATTDGPWSMSGLAYDTIAAGVVREFCKLAFLNHTTTTVAVLDHSALRLQCNLCRDAWPLVLTWRQAIKHLHSVHANNGSGSWKPFPSTIDEPVAMSEAGLKVWACAVSVCTRPNRLRNVADIEKHVREKHEVARPIRGKHYVRAPTAPLLEPLDLLQLYSESKGEPVYECRTCDRSASLDHMLQHLKSQHAMYSTSTPGPESASGSDVEERRGYSRARAISISGSSAGEPEPSLKKRAWARESQGPDTPPGTLDVSLPSEPQSLHVDNDTRHHLNNVDRGGVEDVGGAPTVVQESSQPSNRGAESRPAVASADPPDACPNSLRTTLPAGSRPLSIQGGGVSMGSTDTQALDRLRDPRMNDERVPDDMVAIDPHPSSHQAAPPSPLVPPQHVSSVIAAQHDADTSFRLYAENREEDVEMSFATSDEDEEDTTNLLCAFESIQKPVSHRSHGADARATRTSTSVVSTASDQPFYSCVRCPRAVDRQRLYKLPVLLLHLAKSHSLGAPVPGNDYALVPHDVDQSVLPWSQQKVYSCSLCDPGSSSAPKRLLRWSEIDSHLVISHKVVDPVGGRDYQRHPPEPTTAVEKSAGHGVIPHVLGQPQEPDIDRATLGNALQDVLNKAGVRVNSRIWKAFRCCHCSDGRLLHALGVLQHLASRHRNTHPSYGVDYVMDPAQREEALAKRFQCKLCRPSARTFTTPGVHNHLKSFHGLEVHEYEVHYITAPPDPGHEDSGDESASDVEASDEDKTLKRKRKPNNRDTRQHRCNLCSDDDETYQFAALRRHLDEEHDVTNPVFREHFEPVRSEDGRPVRKKLRTRRE